MNPSCQMRYPYGSRRSALKWFDNTARELAELEYLGPAGAMNMWRARAALSSPWVSHQKNPVKRNVRSSRPAGGFCHSSAGIIRPAQDCSRTYGGSIALCRIDRLDERNFEESVVLRLYPDSNYPHGLHTINFSDGTIVVDGKRNAFHPFAFLLRLRSAHGMKPASAERCAQHRATVDTK